MDEQTMLQIEWNTLDTMLYDYRYAFKLLLLQGNPDLTAETTNFLHSVHGRDMVSTGMLVYDARVGQDVCLTIIPHYFDEASNTYRYKMAFSHGDLSRIFAQITTAMGYITGCDWNSQLFANSIGAAFRELVSERHLA